MSAGNKIGILLSAILMLIFFGTASCPSVSAAEDYSSETDREAVYLGVKNYGRNSINGVERFKYRFYGAGGVELYNIGTGGGAYTVQNKLEEGRIYTLSAEGGMITDVRGSVPDAKGFVTDVSETSFSVNGQMFEITEDTSLYCIIRNAGGADVVQGMICAGDTVAVYSDDPDGNYDGAASDLSDNDNASESMKKALRVYNIQAQYGYEPPVQSVPGLRTVKNLLATGTQPIGTALYMYGGGWNWQDTGGNSLASSIGIPQSWIDFFNSHDANYQFYTENSSRSYYPAGAYNEYNRDGLDCTGFLSWTIYNTMNGENGLFDYVSKSTYYAKKLADDLGYGDFYSRNYNTDFKPGDIMSISGHVWMCAGACGDGSLVIMHSTPGMSVTGCRGGGPQLSAVGGRNSEAYALVTEYMEKYYPVWSSRYIPVAFSYSDYITSGGTVGRFSWDVENGPLSDPDGYRNMSANEILRDLYGE